MCESDTDINVSNPLQQLIYWHVDALSQLSHKLLSVYNCLDVNSTSISVAIT